MTYRELQNQVSKFFDRVSNSDMDRQMSFEDIRAIKELTAGSDEGFIY